MPFFSGKFFCFSCTRTQVEEKREVKVRRASYSTSLRGNLVRTYKTPIEDDYYIDQEHELGKGGCGVVVVGEHKDSHAQYAIKIVNKTTAERGRLDRELKLLKDVDHANIVRLFSLYDVPGHMYFVMELCLGGHLGNLLSRQPLKCVDEDWARKLSAQLISAVAHIHSRGIAHRDIKLQNILIDVTNDRQAQLKLIDFGYGSRYIGALPMKTKCGTPYTTAPEVIRECYDERCDVWSMGVVIYIMLCGRRPFEALDIPGPLSDAGKASMITNILAGRYHFNHKAWQNVSKNGINFVKMLLHPDYKTRIYSHEALEVAWLREGTLSTLQHTMLKSSKSFRAVTTMKKNTEASDLQRTGMLALVFGINSKAAADLRNVFQSFDSDHSGMLSRIEFEKAVHEVSPDLSSADINRLFDIIDIDKNKQISFSEFLAATLDPNEVDIEELSKAFKLLDEDGNGYITREELRKVLTFQYEQANTNNWTLSNNAVRRNSRDLRNVGNIEQLYSIVEEKINHIFDQVDLNNDGFISHGEFLCAMTGLDYYLDSEPFHREPNEDESEDGSEESEEESPPPPATSSSNKATSQLLAQSSHKYREQDLQDLTNNEFEFVNEEEDPVDIELKKASMNAKTAQSPSKKSQPVASPNKSRESSPVRKSPSFEPISTAKSEVPFSNKTGVAKEGTPSPTGLNIRVTSLDRHTKATTAPNTASTAGIKPISSDNDIKYGQNNGSTKRSSPKVQGVEGIQYAAAQKSGTPEASPRRGNLAFYDVEQNIKVAEVSSHDEDLEASPNGVPAVRGVSSGRNSPNRIPSLKKDASNASMTSPAPSSGPGRDSPGMLPTTSSKLLKQPSHGLNKLPAINGSSSKSRHSDAHFKAGIADEENGEDKPTDNRGSFVKLGQSGRQLSYRNTTIIDNDNEPIRVYEVTATTEKIDDLKDDGNDSETEHTKHTRKVSRANIGASNLPNHSHYESVLEHVESPPPLLKAGSKAFSFSLKRGDSTGFGGLNSGEESKEKPMGGTPMLGSLRKIISGGSKGNPILIDEENADWNTSNKKQKVDTSEVKVEEYTWDDVYRAMDRLISTGREANRLAARAELSSTRSFNANMSDSYNPVRPPQYVPPTIAGLSKDGNLPPIPSCAPKFVRDFNKLKVPQLMILEDYYHLSHEGSLNHRRNGIRIVYGVNCKLIKR